MKAPCIKNELLNLIVEHKVRAFNHNTRSTRFQFRYDLDSNKGPFSNEMVLRLPTGFRKWPWSLSGRNSLCKTDINRCQLSGLMVPRYSTFRTRYPPAPLTVAVRPQFWYTAVAGMGNSGYREGIPRNLRYVWLCHHQGPAAPTKLGGEKGKSKAVTGIKSALKKE